MKVSVAQFCRDFDREVKNVYLHFQTSAMPFGSPSDITSDKEFAARYRRWLDTSPHPRLVSEIYQMQIDESEKYQLARFKPEEGVFEPYEWPEKLRNLREKMERERAARESAHMLVQSVIKSNGDKRMDKALSGTFIRLFLGPVDDEIPALIIPIMPPQRPSESSNFSLPVPRKHRIVTLDLDYLKQELIPKLAKQYFSNDGKSDYYIAVVRRDDPQKVIYQSGTGLPKNFIATSDVSDFLFKIQMTEADRLFIAGIPDHQSASKGVSEKGRESKSVNKRIAVGVFQSNVKYSNRGAGTTPHEMGKPTFNLSGDGHWQVALKHR
ncbi:MAG: hypothetical protein L0220_28905, partial [Acidobacteria bacterium]|nr:hypothetical protein [Acidobacteriota bacterium]